MTMATVICVCHKFMLKIVGIKKQKYCHLGIKINTNRAILAYDRLGDPPSSETNYRNRKLNFFTELF